MDLPDLLRERGPSAMREIGYTMQRACNPRKKISTKSKYERVKPTRKDQVKWRQEMNKYRDRSTVIIAILIFASSSLST